MNHEMEHRNKTDIELWVFSFIEESYLQQTIDLKIEMNRMFGMRMVKALITPRYILIPRNK